MIALLFALGCPRAPLEVPVPPPADTPVSADAPAASPAAPAVAFVQRLHEGRFDEAFAAFDPAMASAMTADQLAALWQGLVAGAGPAQRVGEGELEPAPAGYTMVNVPVQFERAEVVLRVALDADGRVAGLFVVPPPSEWVAPPYADPAAFVEREISIGPEDHPLPGTLTAPVGAAGVPAVVLVHGSGPNDRDETLASRKAFKDLAWGLASAGIAVVRYDKRTKVHPQQMLALGGALTVEQEVIDDAVAAAALLREQPEVNGACVFVLGHSLGATVAPRIGARDPQLAGLVLAAGSARPLEDVVVEQYAYLYGLAGLPPDEQPEFVALSRQAEAVRTLTAEVPDDTSMLLGVPAGYWRDLSAHDPPADALALKMPLLVLQGGRDYQVTEADFARWTDVLRARPDVTTRLYPTLDHHFGAGEGPSAPADYSRAAPVAEAVVTDIAAWVHGVCR